jgi:heat shock protein HslJ
MTSHNDASKRDYRVILAWIILALQITGLLWLLLFGREQLAALTGQDSDRAPEVAVAESTAAPTPAPEPTATAEAEPTATVAGDATVTNDGASDTANADVVGPENVLIESSAVAPDWLATLVEGSPADTTDGRPGIPPHLLLTFVGPEGEAAGTVAPDDIDLSRPQVRIIPLAALLAMLEQSGNAAGQQALNELLLLLQQQPDADEASIPVPPVLGNVAQTFVSRAAYRSFGGGAGIGYFTNIAGDEAAPVTNEAGLNYIYQGVTEDGRQYVFVSWPVAAEFLPQAQADAAYETEMLATDRANYYETLREQVAAAADPELDPSPQTLADLVQSLSIGGAVAVAEPEVVPGTAFDAVGFNWYWTGSRNAEGDETAVETPQDYSLILWPDGTYSIRADCNVGGGTYTYDTDGLISLNPGPLSLAMCPEGSRDTEFIESLLAARTIGFNESGDMILGMENGGSMTLANVGPVELGDVAAADDQPAAADAGLSGIALQWPGFTDTNGEVVTVDNPEDYLLTLLPDGTFNVVADCNVGGGAYTFNEDGTLQFGPIRITRMACPDGSRADDFLSFLEGVDNATVGDDGEVTLNAADGRSATFVNLGEMAMTGPESVTEETADAAQAGDPLNTLWQWTSVTTGDGVATPIGNPEAYYVVLLDDGTYVFRADCNNVAGSYSLEGSNLTLNPGAMTLVACDEDSLSDAFVDYLGRVQTFAFDADGSLALTLDDGAILNFANGGPFTASESGALAATDPLAGTSWQWVHFRDMKQDFDVAGTYTVAFNSDGTVSVVADCNTGSGTYRIDGDAGITISIGAITAAACPAGSLGDSFVENLNFAGLFALGNGALTIEIMADGGTMTFAAMQ